MPVLVSGIDYNTGGGIRYIEVRDKHNFDSIRTECCFCMNHLILWCVWFTAWLYEFKGIVSKEQHIYLLNPCSNPDGQKTFIQIHKSYVKALIHIMSIRSPYSVSCKCSKGGSCIRSSAHPYTQRSIQRSMLKAVGKVSCLWFMVWLLWIWILHLIHILKWRTESVSG